MSDEVSAATFVRGVLKAAAQYKTPATLVDVTGAMWHMLNGLSKHPDCTDAALRLAMATCDRLYEHARRCCSHGSNRPDLQRWAREALQPE